MISQEVLKKRREKFMQSIGNGIAVLFSAPQPQSSYQEYRTCSNFYYLTGFF